MCKCGAVTKFIYVHGGRICLSCNEKEKVNYKNPAFRKLSKDRVNKACEKLFEVFHTSKEEIIEKAKSKLMSDTIPRMTYQYILSFFYTKLQVDEMMGKSGTSTVKAVKRVNGWLDCDADYRNTTQEIFKILWKEWKG